EGFLGTTVLALYMGIVTANYAHQASGYNQLLHADYPNHMLVVPRHAPGYQQADFFVSLTKKRNTPLGRHPAQVLLSPAGGLPPHRGRGPPPDRSWPTVPMCTTGR